MFLHDAASTTRAYLATNKPGVKLEPKLYAPVIDAILAGVGDSPHPFHKKCKKHTETYLYHEGNTEAYSSMENSRNGIRSAGLSFKHIINEVSNPEDLISVLQQDGAGRSLIIPGGYAPTFGKSFGLDDMGVDSPVAIAIRNAVQDRGWTFVGDCAGANVACATYFGYDGKIYPGIGLVQGCAMVARDLPKQERGKLSSVKVDIFSSKGDDSSVRSVSVVFCDGPIFRFPGGTESNVLARWSSEESDLAGEPALVSLKRGKGKVILSSMHFESVYLRCPEFVKKYNDIMERNPSLAPQKILEEMVVSYEGTCTISDDVSVARLAECGICDPLNIKENWIVICLLLNEMYGEDTKNVECED